jgi:hypothetical protein
MNPHVHSHFHPRLISRQAFGRSRQQRNVDDYWELVNAQQFEHLLPITPHHFGGISASMRSMPSDSAKRISLAAVNDVGVEVLAHYKSFRLFHDHPYPGYWGIFINGAGARLVASFLQTHYSGADSYSSYLTAAFFFLYRHELFHFHFDKWILSHEEIRRNSIYEPYFDNVYRPYRLSVENLEETLANVIALSSHGHTRSYTEGLRAFAKQMPAPYANVDVNKEDVAATLAGRVLAIGGPSVSAQERLLWQGQLILNKGAFQRTYNTPPTYLVEQFTLH